MKKSFSLIELIVAMGILSFVVLSIYKVKNNNLYLIKKSNNSKKSIERVTLVLNSDSNFKKEETIYLDKYFNLQDDDIRREFKNTKITTSYESLKKYPQEVSTLNFNVEEFKTNYSLEDKISKNIYRFELSLE